MKKVQIETSSLENSDVIDAFKYYFFGKTYSIVNSKLSLRKKKIKLENLLKELNDDPIIKHINKNVLLNPISKIIVDQMTEIDYILELKSFKLPLKMLFFKTSKREDV